MGATIPSAAQAAQEFLEDADALQHADVPSVRLVRRAHSRRWRRFPPELVLEAASILVARRAHRWAAYELVRFDGGAFSALDDGRIEGLAAGLDSWDSVDGFARTLSGPAWAHGLISDALVERWSTSPDRWLRRAALVSTIALNRPAEGGKGDTARTLALCGRLAADRDDMVEKALSWTLRELSKRHPAAVARFLEERRAEFGARVRREVANKLRTGLKNPRSGC
jgi:3-methyladenine DNA glycosylase AlkD